MSGSRVVRDVVYAELPGFRALTLDLRLPEASGAPLVVFVHGGGFGRGSRTVFVPTMPGNAAFERIVAAGFAVASVDYRLSGEATYPAQVDDVAAALAWLRSAEVTGKYGYDAERIVLWGESAGSTISALVAFDVAASVRGVVDWYGLTDIVALMTAQGALDDPSTREAGWLGAPVGDVLELARSASPITRVPVGAPPFLIAHGLDDAAIPSEQSERFAAALRAHGVEVELDLVPGAGHLWLGDVDREALLDRALEFVRRVTR
ncbi:MAG: alpha/beta hydrolase [Actinomycetota bacterium]|nr:alpha/beta hydrolase [Actinomycetota bacterium]